MKDPSAARPDERAGDVRRGEKAEPVKRKRGCRGSSDCSFYSPCPSLSWRHAVMGRASLPSVSGNSSSLCLSS
jgi:TPP-dependent indolepyruvate ferredoxin oxidoreductase alpha subunit